MTGWAARQNHEELPSLAAQNAWMTGDRSWKGPAHKAVVAEYGSERVWFAVRTNPRCEDRALGTLGEKGFVAFLPKGRKVIVHHRTKKEIERTFPLLVGYLFLAMPIEETRRHWGLVRQCHGVLGVLGVNGEPKALPSREVEDLRDAEAGERLRFEAVRRRAAMGPHVFEKGQDARIAFGPFSGFVGQIADASSRRAIRLLISVFGGMTEVSVPVDGLEEVA